MCPLYPFLKSCFARIAFSFVLIGLMLSGQSSAQQQTATKFDIERGRTMLENIIKELKKNYYDPTFHGIDIEARIKKGDERIKQATTNGEIFGIIAQILADLEDSHTYFVPPQRRAKTDYGWKMKMVGDKCFVYEVTPKSDAEAKGLKVGDEVLGVNGYAPTRDTMWKINYLFRLLKPQGGLRVVVQTANEQPRQLDIMAKIKEGKAITDLTNSADFSDFLREIERETDKKRHFFYEVGDNLTIWKMDEFDLEESKVDDIMNKLKKRPLLIIDLRGNGGGYEITLKRLLGHFFDHEIKIGDIKRRKETKALTAKAIGKEPYQGKLVVLVDSDSGSASELFARVIQLEKRGTIIGDKSAGAVMRSIFHPMQIGLDVVTFYGVSITDADITMTDGKSLEHTGITPDEIALPTGPDMANKRDPVLARAAALLGVKLSDEEAGKLTSKSEK